MNEERHVPRSTSANAAVALGIVTVGFAAGLYTPPADAQIAWGTPYYTEEGDMMVCVCDGASQFCGPCYS